MTRLVSSEQSRQRWLERGTHTHRPAAIQREREKMSRRLKCSSERQPYADPPLPANSNWQSRGERRHFAESVWALMTIGLVYRRRTRIQLEPETRQRITTERARSRAHLQWERDKWNLLHTHIEREWINSDARLAQSVSLSLDIDGLWAIVNAIYPSFYLYTPPVIKNSLIYRWLW